MAGYYEVMRDARSDKARTGYLVIVRGPMGGLASNGSTIWQYIEPVSCR